MECRRDCSGFLFGRLLLCLALRAAQGQDQKWLLHPYIMGGQMRAR